LNAPAARAATKQRPTLHRAVPAAAAARPATDDQLDPSQAIVERPALDWSAPPARQSLGHDLKLMAVLAAIFAAVTLFLVSICVISTGW
jgi:hypothetical protein